MRNRFSIGAFRRNPPGQNPQLSKSLTRARLSDALAYSDPADPNTCTDGMVLHHRPYNGLSPNFSGIPHDSSSATKLDSSQSLPKELQNQVGYVLDRESNTNIMMYIFIMLMIAILTINFLIATQNVDFSDFTPQSILKRSEVIRTKIRHQRKIVFGNSALSSAFDNGNMLTAKQTWPYYYEITVGKDPVRDYRRWFYFSVGNVKEPVT